MALQRIEKRKIGLHPDFLQDCSIKCDTCQFKFLCYTTRGDIILDNEYVRELHKSKAKKQGRYFPTDKAD